MTDANVVLGRLNPKSLLGGRMAMHPERARKAIETSCVPALKVDVVEAAAGVIEIINVNMMGAVRVISVEQGEDPRDFTLVAFGGAGPLHAADIARNMGIRNVLVPPRPGICSRRSACCTPTCAAISASRVSCGATPRTSKAINAGFDAAARGAARSGSHGEAVTKARARDTTGSWICATSGQNFELSLAVEGRQARREHRSAACSARFHERHLEFYGYDMREQAVEIVNLRLAVTVERAAPTPEKQSSRARHPERMRWSKSARSGFPRPAS